MKKLQFKAAFNASAAKVYNIMLGLDNIETYNQWTSEFSPTPSSTSTYEGSWDKGAKILFVGIDENGKRGGMVAEIAENIPNRFVSIRSYGILEGENEITTGPEVEKWAGGFENYSFEESNGITTLKVEIDVTEDYVDYFNKTWPIALNKLKDIVENS